MESHLLQVFLLVLSTQFMGWVFHRLNQPLVLGQLLAGVLLGPSLLGWVHEGEVLGFIAELGAIFLLFLVGLEVRLKDILSVGKEAILVALIGVLLPFAAGIIFGTAMDYSQIATLFVGTALVATSVGITAAVLQELGVLSRSYSRIILGAAVIDDILSLIVLGIVSGMAQEGNVAVLEVVELMALAIVFVGGAMALAPIVRRLPLDRLPSWGPYAVTLILGLGMASLASEIGLAPIVGAFLAGTLLAEVEEEHRLSRRVHAVEFFLAPIFFAMVGVQLDLSVLLTPQILALGGLLSLIAILTKVVGGLGALSHGIRRASVVGMGMVPRGEVILIVVAVGLAEGAISQAQYAMMLSIVVVTTVLAPLLLRVLVPWAESEQRPGPPQAHEGNAESG
mgnify:CR=1 FL=1